ncbi:MAG: hypothetical protein RLY86_3745, partial [Pseudomonadota bacterium]
MPNDPLGVPDFHEDRLHVYLRGDPGDAFQQLAGLTLAKLHPGIRLYQTAGKDGAIDARMDGPGAVMEAKHTGAGIEAGRRAWVEVLDKLNRHLAEPAGPTSGQGQYGPWYAHCRYPIRRYLFCMSGALANENQRQTLEQEIAAGFTALADRNPRLAHLRGIEVTVHDWSYFRPVLDGDPVLRARFFPLPTGLRTLRQVVENDRKRTRSGRRAFLDLLDSGTLPYYSRADHLAGHPAPAGADIRDEAGLLDILETNRETGLVLTGPGGFGKTRLMRELGELAETRGWLVLQPEESAGAELVTTLHRLVGPGQKVLLLLDYVETRSAFIGLVQSLVDANEEDDCRWHYVANCRATYRDSLDGLQGQRVVEIDPGAPAAAAWHKGYREETVRRILGHAGIPVDDGLLRACRGTPILAAFLFHLQATGGDLDLGRLRQGGTFRDWVWRRLQRTFHGLSLETLRTPLSQFMGLLPLPERDAQTVALDQRAILVERLLRDLWIDRDPDPDGRDWLVVAHDVLADQVLGDHLREAPTAGPRVQALLTLAEQTGAVESALLALARLHGDLPVIPWSRIIAERLRENPGAWRGARGLLFRSPLLDAAEKLRLLTEHAGTVDGLESDPDFQNSLGWMVRQVRDGNLPDAAAASVIQGWVDRAAPAVFVSNFLLTMALRWQPARYRDRAMAWFAYAPQAVQTHYLLVAWLKAGLPWQEISGQVRAWLDRHAGHDKASFLLAAWLDAGGDLAAVADGVQAWLKLHDMAPKAQFVYKAWLDAGGDLAAVADGVQAWLKLHDMAPKAQFVYKAWLDAGGDGAVFADGVQAW